MPPVIWKDSGVKKHARANSLTNHKFSACQNDICHEDTAELKTKAAHTEF